MSYILPATHQVPVSVDFQDKSGQPARVDGIPQWSTDNSELLALAPAEDGMSCLVSAVGPLGEATVTLTADADRGEGVVPIYGSLEIEVTSGMAALVVLTPGTAVEQVLPETPVDDAPAVEMDSVSDLGDVDDVATEEVIEADAAESESV